MKSTSISQGAIRFASPQVTLQRAGHYGQAQKTFGPFQCWVVPLPASRSTSSGRFMCMALPPADEVRHRKSGCSRQHSEIRSERLLWMMLATPNGCPTVPFGVSWAFLAAGAATRRPKCPQGTEQRRAPNVTHSVLWRTHVSETIQITIYFEHCIMKRKWSVK